MVPMHLGLINGPVVSYNLITLRGALFLAKFPDGPQT